MSGGVVGDGSPTGAEPYVISDERLAEIRALLIPGGYYVLTALGVSLQALASAAYDLLAERDDRG